MRGQIKQQAGGRYRPSFCSGLHRVDARVGFDSDLNRAEDFE